MYLIGSRRGLSLKKIFLSILLAEASTTDPLNLFSVSFTTISSNASLLFKFTLSWFDWFKLKKR